MKNNLESAKNFFLSNISHVDGEPNVYELAQILVAYSTATNNIVLPSDEQIDELIDNIDIMAETSGSFVTAKFGDNWKAHSEQIGYEVSELLHMVWYQGRRALLFEREIKKQSLLKSLNQSKPSPL
jgi:hypothetical protein